MKILVKKGFSFKKQKKKKKKKKKHMAMLSAEYRPFFSLPQCVNNITVSYHQVTSIRFVTYPRSESICDNSYSILNGSVLKRVIK